MSFDNPRSAAAITAPSTPSGITSITDTGTDQLSYSAARHRKTTRIDSANSSGACPPDSRSWYDRPLQAWPVPLCFFARVSMAAMAVPELTPCAAAPWICTAGRPL
ncbi:hypothetical protein D3C72_1859780 [compost metagenome]